MAETNTYLCDECKDCGCGCDCCSQSSSLVVPTVFGLSCTNLQVGSSNSSITVSKSGNCVIDLIVNPAFIPFITGNTPSVTLSGNSRTTPLIADVNISAAPGNGIVINSDGIFCPGGITDELDPLALAKTVTVVQGTGVIVTGTTQTLALNPTFTVAVNPSYIRGLFSQGAGIIYNSGTGQISSSIVAYSDEKAQDAVGGILIDTNSIDFTYNDPANTIRADVKDSYLYSKMGMIETFYRVGQPMAPEAGDILFSLRDCNDNILRNVKINFFRERLLQISNDDYTYDPLTGTIRVYIPLMDRERLVIQSYPIATWQSCSVGSSLLGGTPPGFPYTLPLTLS